jgi:hypothetical protein
MKTICRFSFYLIALAVVCIETIDAAAAQPSPREPIVSLTATNLPLGEALATLSRDTGYRFSLNSQWTTHPVSVNFSGIPLEEALNRLLRNLNHSIVWESEDSIRIMVYGTSEAAGSPQAVTFAAPPQEEAPEAIERFDAVESPAEDSVEEAGQDDAAEMPEETVPDEPGGDEGDSSLEEVSE